MRTDALIECLLIYRNRDKWKDKPIRVILADKEPKGTIPTFKTVEEIKILPNQTEIYVLDLERPLYYHLPDGTRRKIYFSLKKKQKKEE